LEYRELGKTGEKVSTIGMGTWGIGVYSSSEERSRQVRALQRGLELGINLIDTAEMYHSGRSEQIVGEAVKGMREKVFIATKVSPDHLHRQEVLSACEGSLKHLGTSYIDLYQVHWPNPRVPIKETMAAMEELVAAGKIRHIGVSNFDVKETKAAREALSKNDVASNQVEYSLRNRYVEADILPYCEKEKVSLIAYSPLARGNVLFSRMPKGLQERYGLTPAQMMLNWVTRSERVLAIPKSANLSHQDENAASVSVRLTGSEYDQISSVG
jgi:diketogulonate reductase-like aldo/keto reductase